MMYCIGLLDLSCKLQVEVLMWMGNEEQRGWHWEEETSWAFSFGKVSIFCYKQMVLGHSNASLQGGQVVENEQLPQQETEMSSSWSLQREWSQEPKQFYSYIPAKIILSLLWWPSLSSGSLVFIQRHWCRPGRSRQGTKMHQSHNYHQYWILSNG